MTGARPHAITQISRKSKKVVKSMTVPIVQRCTGRHHMKKLAYKQNCAVDPHLCGSGSGTSILGQCGSGSRSSFSSGSGELMPKNCKILQLKNPIFFQNYNLFILKPPWRTYKLQEKHFTPKREHPAFENMKFFNISLLLCHFCWSFLPAWIPI
jgi:hypothetical protein